MKSILKMAFAVFLGLWMYTISQICMLLIIWALIIGGIFNSISPAGANTNPVSPQYNFMQLTPPQDTPDYLVPPIRLATETPQP